MIYGHDTTDRPVRATPGTKAFCPDCQTPLVAKCGSLIVWHFAHQAANPGCGYAHESAWHLRWKEHVLTLGWQVEKRMLGPDGEYHRADIVTAKGNVIELQHTALNVDEIRQRENAYGIRYLAWIYDIGSMLAARGPLFDEADWEPPHGPTFTLGRVVKGKTWKGGFGFRIRNGPKSMATHQAPVFWHYQSPSGASSLWRVDLSLVEHGDSERIVGRAHDVSEKWRLVIPPIESMKETA